MGVSLRGIEGVLEWLGVDRSFQTVRYWKAAHARAESDFAKNTARMFPTRLWSDGLSVYTATVRDRVAEPGAGWNVLRGHPHLRTGGHSEERESTE